jgi:murein L,D-transpeptidase YafK
LRTLSLALSLAVALMGAALAFTLPHTQPQTRERSTELATKLQQRGLRAGSPILIRIFKGESELEVWMENDGRFELFATYPICLWSGRLGPKEHEGDRQAPEGFYTVGAAQLHQSERHPHSLNIGFPNAFDRSLGRTGSLILVHGGCSSIGCFAMTDAVMDEIYGLAEQALANGQPEIQLEIFPFRMGDEDMARHTASKWHDFWSNLKEGYDAFERTHLPPRVTACGGRYLFSDQLALSKPEDEAADARCQTSPAVVAWRAPPAPRHIKRHVASSRAFTRGARHHVGDGHGRGSTRIHLAHNSRRASSGGQLRVR